MLQKARSRGHWEGGGHDTPDGVVSGEDGGKCGQHAHALVHCARAAASRSCWVDCGALKLISRAHTHKLA